LAKLLSIHAFRDYSTIEDLLKVVPPKDTKSFPIVWREDLLEQPFYSSASGDGSIETASAFHRRLISAGIRAGFPEPPTIHDWRANSLFLIGISVDYRNMVFNSANVYVCIDKHYSEPDRMQAAAHENPNTYGQSYQSSESRVDGQNTFLGNERREDVSDAFLELSVPYTPNLAQRLPAEEKYKLQTSQEYLELEEEIEAVRDEMDADCKTCKDCIQELQRKKSQLMDEALQEWQKVQPYHPDDPPRYHYGIFDRCRFMMPERDRLATNLFKSATLRSPLGLSVLRDLMALLKKTSEVEFRPGLERNKCVCPKLKKEESQDDTDETPPSKYDWRHIYNCYKKNCCSKYGFAELCFMCNEWVFFSEQEWSDHCLRHLRDLDSLPIHFDPLIYGGVLATPGYCPYCLRDERLPPANRMYQYLYRNMWLAHIQRHIEKLEKQEQQKEGRGTVAICPHPEQRCPKSFHSVLRLQFHLEDIHGIPMVTVKSKAKKRARKESKQAQQAQQTPKKRYKSEHDSFINITAAMMDAPSKRESKVSTPCNNSAGSGWSADGHSGQHNTPPPSVSSDFDVVSKERGGAPVTILSPASAASVAASVTANPATSTESVKASVTANSATSTASITASVTTSVTANPATSTASVTTSLTTSLTTSVTTSVTANPATSTACYSKESLFCLGRA
jgi:hypothetical protein